MSLNDYPKLFWDEVNDSRGIRGAAEEVELCREPQIVEHINDDHVENENVKI